MARPSIYLDDLARKTIRTARENRRLSIPEMATIIGCSRVMLQAVETGVKHPSSDTLDAICQSLDLEWREQSAAIFAKVQPKPPKKEAR